MRGLVVGMLFSPRALRAKRSATHVMDLDKAGVWDALQNRDLPCFV